MALVRHDRVKEATFVEGSVNDIDLLGSGTGFKRFQDVAQDGDTFDYAITHTGTAEWETGRGTYDSANNKIVRTTIIASSEEDSTESNAPTNFSAGTKQVFITVNSASLELYDATAEDLAALALALGG